MILVKAVTAPRRRTDAAGHQQDRLEDDDRIVGVVRQAGGPLADARPLDLMTGNSQHGQLVELFVEVGGIMASDCSRPDRIVTASHANSAARSESKSCTAHSSVGTTANTPWPSKQCRVFGEDLANADGAGPGIGLASAPWGLSLRWGGPPPLDRLRQGGINSLPFVRRSDNLRTKNRYCQLSSSVGKEAGVLAALDLWLFRQSSLHVLGSDVASPSDWRVLAICLVCTDR